VVLGTDYSDIVFYCSYHLKEVITNSLPVGLRGSTTADEVFQHIKAQLLVIKSVFKLKMAEDNF